MSQLIPFESNKLPAFLKGRSQPVTNEEFTAHAGGGGYPVISIKGKVFTLVVNKERTVITRPDDPDEAATSLELVILKANKNLSKVWYAKTWEEGDNAKPDCMSEDGIRPDASIAEPQAKSCAVCPKNVWGSGKEGKGKACQDSRRVAVARPDKLDDPILLRIPPASLKPLAEYGKKLNERNTYVFEVVTKVRFEREVATPQLEFVWPPVGFVSDEMREQIEKMRASDIVNQIIGAVPQAEEQFEQAAPKAEATPKAEAEPAAKASKPKAPAKPKPAPAESEAETSPAKVASGDNLDEELDDLLAQLDD